jgi:DegV family protein with EDD domain
MVRQEYPDQPIELYDSKTATIAQGFIAIEAARLAVEGASLAQVLTRSVDVRSRVGFVPSLETLDFLARGGRIGKAAYLMGSLIKILPVLTIDENGMVVPTARVRGEHRVLEKNMGHRRGIS